MEPDVDVGKHLLELPSILRPPSNVRSVTILFGWSIQKESALSGLDPAVMVEGGLVTLLDASGKSAYVGKCLSALSLVAGEFSVGAALPMMETSELMRHTLRIAGFEAPPEPAILYAVVG